MEMRIYDLSEWQKRKYSGKYVAYDSLQRSPRVLYSADTLEDISAWFQSHNYHRVKTLEESFKIPVIQYVKTKEEQQEELYTCYVN